MGQDPLTDFSQVAEHQLMKEGLQNLRMEAMSRAEKSLAEGNIETARQEQDAAVAELERLSSLSEEIYKRGKMQSLIYAADRLNEKGEQFTEKLESGKRPNSKELKMLQDLLKETMETLAQIAQQIKDLPQELPDDFVNQPAVKNMDLGEIAQSARQLSQALQKGDVRSALEAAKKMLEQVRSARQTLAKAAEASTPWTSGQLAQQLTENQNRLNQIIDRQEKLLQNTGKFESKRVQFQLDLQKRILNELAKRQKQVIQQSGELIRELQAQPSLPTSLFSVMDTLNAVIPIMQKVTVELEQKNVMFSQKWLEQIVQNLGTGSRTIASAMLTQLSTDTAHPDLWLKALDEKYGSIQQEEQAILKTLRQPPTSLEENPFSTQDLGELNQLSKEQQTLSQDTQKLRSELGSLGNKSAVVGPEILNALKGAQQEMRSAGQSLSEGKTQPAQESEQKALSLLRQGQQGLQNSEQQVGEMQSAARAGRPSPILQMRNPPGSEQQEMTGGRMGVKTGVVKIPSAEDYLPPRQFREELLESLKERYPKSEEEAIKDYYKRLSR
jgi:hypothetical protein